MIGVHDTFLNRMRRRGVSACLAVLCIGIIPAYAASSDANRFFEIGKSYHDGSGVSQDFYQAHKFYKTAVDMGSADAMINLGYMYFLGQGVPQDFVKARDWYQKAVAAGDMSALRNLQMMDAAKLGVPSLKIALSQPASFGFAPSPISMETYTNSLIDKIKGSFPIPSGRRISKEPWLTACNRFIAHALLHAYGYDGFINPDQATLDRLGIKASDKTSSSPNHYLRAEHIRTYLRTSQEWEKLGTGSSQEALSDAADLATVGFPVIAVTKGHVALIMPGDTTRSSSWRRDVPYVASFRLGRLKESFYYKPISYAWSAKYRNDVEIYVLR